MIEFVIKQGSEAVNALSKWSDAELLEFGSELALRATKDAEALKATSKLVELLRALNPRQADLLLNILSSLVSAKSGRRNNRNNVPGKSNLTN